MESFFYTQSFGLSSKVLHMAYGLLHTFLGQSFSKDRVLRTPYCKIYMCNITCCILSPLNNFAKAELSSRGPWVGLWCLVCRWGRERAFPNYTTWAFPTYR